MAASCATASQSAGWPNRTRPTITAVRVVQRSLGSRSALLERDQLDAGHRELGRVRRNGSKTHWLRR
jgi:hypothetical protein